MSTTRLTVLELAREHSGYARRQVARGRMKPRTAAEIERLYRAAIEPELGKLALESLTPLVAEKWHARLADGAPVVANRAAAVLRCGWNLAARWKWVRSEDNPLRDLREFKAPEKPRCRVLDGQEWARLRRVLEAHQEIPELRMQASAVLLLMLTGARHREILGLRWEWLTTDGRSAYFDLPDSKTGAKRVFLSEGALGLVARVAFWAGAPTCPPSSGPVFPHVYLKRYWPRTLAVAKVTPAAIHDLRRTFCTRLAESGVPAEDVAALLGQKTVSVQINVYRKISDARKNELANRAASLLAVEGSDEA